MYDVQARQKQTELQKLIASGQHAEAMTLSEQLIEQHSELSLPWLVLAQQSERMQNAKKAEFYYSKLLTLQPNSLIARAGVALMTMHQLKLPEARLHFREALHILSSGTSVPQTSKQAKRDDFNTPQHEFVLWQTLALLAQHEIHAVAHAGTLLGLIREGALLQGDKDLDLALPFHEIKRAVDCLLNHGWEMTPLPMPLINPISCRHRETGLILDLCGVKVCDNTQEVISGFWTSDPRDHWQRVTLFCHPFSIKQTDSPAGMVWSLVDPEGWLSDLYGDWKTPDPEFDTIIFAANMQGFSLLTQCYAYNRLVWHWTNGNLKHALRIAQFMSQKMFGDVLMKQVADQLMELN